MLNIKKKIHNKMLMLLLLKKIKNMCLDKYIYIYIYIYIYVCVFNLVCFKNMIISH